MLTVETLQGLVIEPKKSAPVQYDESSTMTDVLQAHDRETDPMECRSIAVGTEADEQKPTAEGVLIQEETIGLLESLLRESAASRKIFDRLDPFHANSLVQLQPIRTSVVNTLSSMTLPVVSLSCGTAGRTAILIGETEHDTWCSHEGKVIIAQRSRVATIPLAVCPSCSAWSGQGMLVVGDVAGDIHLIIADAAVSVLKAHSQSVTDIEWISQSQLVSCGTDGQVALLKLKGTTLEVEKSLRLSVTDLPRKIRRSSTSTKSVSIVAMSRCRDEICIASETGGLWLVSVPDLRLRPIVSEPQAVHSVLYLSPFIAVCGDDESTTLVLNDGSFVDTLPIGAVHLCKIDDELMVLADGSQLLIYDTTIKAVVLDEKRPMRSMNASSRGDLLVLSENELTTYRLMRTSA
ncbi:hypothetical protein Q1695_008267 [Nippostrongylus brasiliensis]|nr:hypothetical protein Q1695_008267 [Nippostrongylus brasiliensis]